MVPSRRPENRLPIQVDSLTRDSFCRRQRIWRIRALELVLSAQYLHQGGQGGVLVSRFVLSDVLQPGPDVLTADGQAVVLEFSVDLALSFIDVGQELPQVLRGVEQRLSPVAAQGKGPFSIGSSQAVEARSVLHFLQGIVEHGGPLVGQFKNLHGSQELPGAVGFHLGESQQAPRDPGLGEGPGNREHCPDRQLSQKCPHPEAPCPRPLCQGLPVLSKRRVVLMHYSRVVSKTIEDGAKGQEVGGKPRRVRVLKALTAVVALVLVFALVQLFQRSGSEAIYGFDADSTLIVRQIAELGPGIHLLLPNLRGARVVVPARPHDPREFQDPANRRKLQRRQIFHVNTNSLSTRGAEPSRDPRDFNILCLGDSVTFGWGYEQEQAYPALLAQELGVEVINAGVPSLKPGHMAGWLKLLKQEVPVDLVLFSTRPDMVNPNRWSDYRKAAGEAAAIAHPAPMGIVLAPHSTFDAQDPARVAKETQQVIRTVEPIPVLDLTQAFREQRPDRGVILEREGSLQRVVSLPGREVLLEVQVPPHGVAPEIGALFDRNTDLVEPLFFDGGHPDDEGLQLFAREVARWVRAQGWVPESAE